MNKSKTSVNKTFKEFSKVIFKCKHLFENKAKDYGVAWRILRLPSITDQIFIKAQRIRSVEVKKRHKISDDIQLEYVGIVNYCIIATIQLKIGFDNSLDLSIEKVMNLYDESVNETMELLKNKNHDYAEAWRDMRLTSITDIILMKLYRIKQIEDNEGKTIISEGVLANYQDILNYAVFALIKLNYLLNDDEDNCR